MSSLGFLTNFCLCICFNTAKFLWWFSIIYLLFCIKFCKKKKIMYFVRNPDPTAALWGPILPVSWPWKKGPWVCAHVLRSLLQKSCGVLISGYQEKKSLPTTVFSFLEHSCAILSSFKILIIFISSSLFTILKELRLAQLCSKNEWKP